MKKDELKRLIDASMGRDKADLKLKNANVVDVFNQDTFKADVYVKDGYIIGFDGERDAKEEIDAEGKFLIPGFIDSHCHIESSHLSPSEFSDAVTPCGTTTVIADPHEICNVAGLDALKYMMKSAENAPLNIFYMFPSCVPATPFEHSGAVLEAKEIESVLDDDKLLGLGEMMNYPGIINADDSVLAKLESAHKRNKLIDGHVPSIQGQGLDAYILTGISTDHECETPDELREKVRKGMYVMLRQGTACKNVLQLLPGVDDKNYRRTVFCTDDRQPQSITREGHINYAVNLAISGGLDPLKAITIATLNASECYRLRDRGAIAPGRRADFFLSDSIEVIKPTKVFIGGKLVGENGKATIKAPHIKPEGVSGRMEIKDFTRDSLKLKLNSDKVRVIEIIPGGVVTGKGEAIVKRDKDSLWVHNPDEDVLKLAVVERHHGTGNVGLALIRGYGMKHGAVATSIAHDSHNIIVIGDNDEDMYLAVKELERIGGGITMFKDGKNLGTHQLEIGGLMTDLPLEEVTKCLDELHETADKELHVNKDIDPFMTLCFMALPVIPSYKLTDCGLFDVTTFSFVDINL